MKFFKKLQIPNKIGNKKKIGLSLRGGGARAFAYLGLLQFFEEEGIEISALVGSSAGAIIAGCYAAGIPLEKIAEHGSKISVTKLGTFDSAKLIKPFDAKKSIAYTKELVGTIKIEETQIKLIVQTTLARNNERELLEHGGLAEAIIASSALNLLMDPVEIAGQEYVDGDFSAGYEAAYLRTIGCDVVIGANVGYPTKDNYQMDDRISHAIGRFIDTILDYDKEKDPLDLELNNLGGNVGGLADYRKTFEFMEHGYKVAQAERDKILSIV